MQKHLAQPVQWQSVISAVLHESLMPIFKNPNMRFKAVSETEKLERKKCTIAEASLPLARLQKYERVVIRVI